MSKRGKVLVLKLRSSLVKLFREQEVSAFILSQQEKGYSGFFLGDRVKGIIGLRSMIVHPIC